MRHNRAVLDRHVATRYVLPLREGGSLPAVLDTAEGGLFVTKFRGAGQGARALVAEIVVGSLALALELEMPEMVLVELDEAFARSERDPEIQDILRGSRGLNVAHRYLEGALNFDPVADIVDSEFAARTVWLDALVSNIDRTAHNPNMVWWSQRPWLIDHGAALYFHHNWAAVDEASASRPFAPISDHVLLGAADDLAEVDPDLASRIDPDVIDEALEAVPDEILMDAPPGIEAPFASPELNRDAYRRYFAARLASPRAFATAASHAQNQARDVPRERRSYRR